MTVKAGQRQLRLQRRRIRSVYEQAHSTAVADATGLTPLARLKHELDDLLLVQQRALADRDSLTDAWHGALTPRRLPAIEGVQLASHYEPGNARIGGDFYDVAPARDGSWAVSLGDVCGKGAQAATTAALVRHSLRTVAQVIDEPASALQVAHRVLVADADVLDPLFCTAAYARLFPGSASVELRLALAGHPPALVLRNNGGVEQAGIPGMALGIVDDPEDLELHEVAVFLEPGEVLVMYTDGVTDARNGREFFGQDRLTDVLSSCRDMGPQSIVDCIHRAVADFRDGTSQDDIALLSLTCVRPS